MPCEIVTIEDFENVTKTEKLVIINFWADWNATDSIAKNILSDLEVEFKEITFCSIDVDKESLWDFIKSIGIKGVHAIAYFKDGNNLGVEIGLRTKEGFQDRINYYFLS